MEDNVPAVPRGVPSGHHPSCNNPDECKCNSTPPEVLDSRGVHSPCVLHVGCEVYLSPIPGVGVTHVQPKGNGAREDHEDRDAE